MQSTYCSTVVEYCQSVKRSIHVVNLDPAAEHFSYPVEAGEGGRLAGRNLIHTNYVIHGHAVLCITQDSHMATYKLHIVLTLKDSVMISQVEACRD